MKLRNSLPGVRILTYFVLTGVVTAVLVVVLNLLFVGMLFYRQWKDVQGGTNYVSGKELLAALDRTDAGYEPGEDMRTELTRRKQWAMLLDENGQVVWSYEKPAEVPDTYSRSDIARMTRWYLKEYPVHIYVQDERIMVVGKEKDSMWKYSVEFSLSWIVFLRQVWYWMLFLNFLCILILSVFFTRRWSISRERARMEWISGISHDIRTPLSMVLGYADTLENSENLSEQERQQMAVIRNQSMVLKALVEDLNLTSGLEYSMQPLHVEEVRPTAVVREVAADILGSAGEGKLEIEVCISDQAERLWIAADRKLLIRALRNLFHNSLQHSGQKETMVIILRVWQERKWCCISFSDNGVGYSPEILRQLQGRKKNRAEQKIRGLGIVRKVVLAHGGKIRFENNKEGGSFCEIRLRTCRKKADKAAKNVT